MNYKTTVVLSIDSEYYAKMKEGDVVTLCLAEQNPADAEAVSVYYDNTHIGYIANSAHTTIKDTRSAGSLRKLMAKPKVSQTVAVLRHEVGFVNKADQLQRSFCAETFFVPARVKTPQKDTTRTYIVGGASAKAPKKTAVIGELQKAAEDNREPDIPIVVCRMKMSGTVGSAYNVFLASDTAAGASCGTISNPDNALDELFDSTDMVSGRALRIDTRSAYIIEVYQNNRTIDNFFDDIDGAIRRGVAQTAELEERVTFMLKSGFADKTISKVLEQMPMSNDQVNVPRPKQFYYQRNGSNLADAMCYALRGKTVQLVGEKGSGKNTLVETVCWLLGRPLYRMQGSSELDKFDIFGSKSLNKGNTQFELSELLQTLSGGGIAVIDEANTIRPDVFILLHSLTDNTRAINVPGYGEVKMHPNSCLLYTLNENYAGTGDMNPASVDRGPRIIVRQEVNISRLLKDAVPGASDADIEVCVKVSDGILKAVTESGTLTQDAVTIRGYIDALECCDVIPIKRALIHNVANKAQTESERAAIEGIICSFVA